MTWADENGWNILNWKSNPPSVSLPHSTSLQPISYLSFSTEPMCTELRYTSALILLLFPIWDPDTHCSAFCCFSDYISETAPCCHTWTHVTLFNAMAYARGWQTTAHRPNLACCCQFCKYTVIFMDHSHAHWFPIAYSTCELQRQSWGAVADHKVWKT